MGKEKLKPRKSNLILYQYWRAHKIWDKLFFGKVQTVEILRIMVYNLYIFFIKKKKKKKKKPQKLWTPSFHKLTIKFQSQKISYHLLNTLSKVYVYCVFFYHCFKNKTFWTIWKICIQSSLPNTKQLLSKLILKIQSWKTQDSS